MIAHIAVTGVYVSDEEKALDFYVNKLGFEKRADGPMGDGPRWIEVAPPGAEICLVLTRGFGGWSPEKVGQFAGIVFAPDDIDATIRMLTTHGASPRCWARRRSGTWVCTKASTWDNAGTGMGTGHLRHTGLNQTPSVPDGALGRIPVFAHNSW